MRVADRVLEKAREVQQTYHASEGVPDFPRIEKVVKILSRKRPGRHLDVGYTEGSFADLLSRQGWDCLGLDVNQPRHPKIRVIQCDLNEGFPVETEAFDLVTAGEVIEHMLDEEFFLEECHRVLKKGGTSVITTPNLAFSLNRFLVPLGRTPLFVTAPYHYHFYTRRSLTQLIEHHGFQVERVISSHLLYSRRRHFTGAFFELLGDLFPTLGAHLIVFARKSP